MYPFHYCDVAVYGFHGCDISVKEQLLNGSIKFQSSTNRYDWLGPGVYFWENDFVRAHEWALEAHGKNAAVLGAKIRLGHCFDLSNLFAKEILRISYDDLVQDWNNTKTAFPVNQPHPRGKGNPADLILRYLDRAVIDYAFSLASTRDIPTTFDTVRAPFQEGFPVYPGSAFREHDHIHLCVRNPDLLTELFDPGR
ncbi:hypothetical protein J2Y45_004640 [Dyadobacter sp. BE34]|uniref:DUF3990 domain-containing protein n=1 Tax=Dyadobacter fermentans TaxID=94254 RepID=A0ABU1R0U0_9BACT|nr:MULTISPECIES: hypothetical protein [Dyadobacter]MDR6807026.1 hypothetical protein [Dyadobacter fermentans]MDR7044767.1 hypothetical protein [Dyadobacter sp. BE242]MDR7199497.1 hypothetical protein [Dyadobacter sp. BE34]MDR7217457.1 hypothetical protein [Dyadobacter sp. BE31]MDR7265389.1 hypothetical protein [Dyadobacter sp. BE32]